MDRLLRFANTPYGRRLFGVPKGKEVVKITEGSVHYYTGKLSKNHKNYGARVICAQGSPGGAVIKQVLHLLKCFPEAIGMAEMGLEYPLPLIMLADTGLKSPTTNSQAGGGAWDDFTNPEKAYSSNNDYASESMGSGGGSLKQSYETFAFGIPGGATIDGVEISSEWYGVGDPGPALADIGPYWRCTSDTSNSDRKLLTWITVEDTEVLGGAADLWGRTPIDTDFSDANFYMVMDFESLGNGGTLEVYFDHIQVKVYYTAAAGGGGLSAKMALLKVGA